MSLIKNENSINSIYNISNHIHNLFQNFYIIGLDNKITSKLAFYKNEHMILYPSVISKYPYKSLPYLEIPNEIIASHCFPNGYKLLDQLSDKKITEYFIFCLDNPNLINYNNNNNYNHEKIYFTCLVFYENIKDYYKVFSMKNSKYINDLIINQKYIPKAICISSFIPLFRDYIKILNLLKNYICSNKEIGIEFPIEKIIENLIFNIPTPPKGMYKINYELLNEKFIFYQNPPNQLPNVQVDYFVLFYYFKIEQVFLIIKAILLDYPVLIFGKNKFDLSNIIFCLINLLYPLNYCYTVVTILPIENFSFIQIMKKFIIGINMNYYPAIFENFGIEINDIK